MESIIIIIIIIIIVVILLLLLLILILILTLVMKAVDMSRCAICMDPRLTLPVNREYVGETKPWLFTYSHDILTLAWYTRAG